jgi:hypothetical protein
MSHPAFRSACLNSLDDDDYEQKELLQLFVVVTMNDVHHDSVAIFTSVATGRQRHRLTQINILYFTS